MALCASRLMTSLTFSTILLLLLSSHCKAATKGQLIELNEDTWQELLQGEWMVEFFAPWCPACKALGPVWKEFSAWSLDLSVKVAHIDVTANPGLSGRFMVTALPTIYHVKDGVFRQYRGSRDKESFIMFVEEKKWEQVESVSSWKSPQSIQMSLVAQFFKLSMAVRSLHTTLVDYYGVPYWGSYILFALATVVVGALLGLLIVFIIDVVFPPKTLILPSQQGDRAVDKNGDGDAQGPEANKSEEDDVIEDDSDKLNNQELRRRRPDQ